MGHAEQRALCIKELTVPGRARLFGDSIIYGSMGTDSRSCRHAASILAAVTERPIDVHAGGEQLSGLLLAVRPQVAKHLMASGTPFVLIDLEPNHPHYRAFRGITTPTGVQLLCAGRHARVLATARAFFTGALQGSDLDQAVAQAIEELTAAFAPQPPLDMRVRQIMTMIEEDIHCSVGSLSKAVGLSPHRVSELFSASMGISLRRYRLSCKIRVAASYMGSGYSLTDIALAAGFVDSAHFAKLWTRTYGAPPSVYFPAVRTNMDLTALPDWLQWHHARRAPGLAPGDIHPAMLWPAGAAELKARSIEGLVAPPSPR